MNTVRSLMGEALAAGLPRLEAQLLLGALLQRDRAWLMIHEDDALDAPTAQRFADWLAQRLDEVPLAYLVGYKEFHGLRLAVNPATLVPRPDTEVIVDWALDLLRERPALPAPRVLDLGTGSGAIALAVKQGCPAAEVCATDFSAAALATAEVNAKTLALPARFFLGPWWDALPSGEPAFDLVLSNPPYIAPGDPHLAALRHEPATALSASDEGLADLRIIVAGARARLRHGGWLLLEHGYDQAEAVAELLRQAGFHDIGLQRDLGGQPRVTGGRWQASDALC